MSLRDSIGLGLSYIYAFGLLFTVESIGKRLKWPQDLTRKLVHIGAGMWIWGILVFFDHWYYGIIPFGTFILLNYAFYRMQTFKTMDTQESTPGTVYFAISITILFGLLWRTGGELDRVPIAAAAVMAMTLGDGLASIVGNRWGKHPYTFMNHTRSWEGTIAMAVFGFAGIYLTLWLLSGSTLSPNSVPLSAPQTFLPALLGTIVATTAEGLSPSGTDNLSVPLLTGLVLYLLIG
ncbi:MAG: phosphatidate cytidylyltransferase [Anaerolineae bacterium]|nr:phosphatidate cytidylyltransferase [Anaerolineae bacterium]